MRIYGSVVAVEELVRLLKALCDASRLKIFRILVENEYCVNELVEVSGLSQSAVSQHLAKLKAAGLVRERRRGQWSFYSADTRTAERLAESLATFLRRPLTEMAEMRTEYDRLRRLDRKSCCNDGEVAP